MKKLILISALLIIAFSCQENNELSLNVKSLLGFEESAGNLIETNESGYRVSLYSNTTIKDAITATIKVNNLGTMTYGVDYITEPAPVDNIITLSITEEELVSGNANGLLFFEVYPLINPDAPEVRNLSFDLIEVTGGSVKLGQASSTTFTLSILPDNQPHELQSYAFEDCNTSPVGPTEQIVTGAMSASTWGCTTFGNNSTKATEANAFGKGTGTSNSYLVFPAINGDEYSKLSIAFQIYSHYTGGGNIKVKYSNTYSGTGNPEAIGVTWTEMTSITSQLPGAGSRVWTAVSGDITGVSGTNFYIAIQYQGATSASASNWRIDDLTIKGTK